MEVQVYYIDLTSVIYNSRDKQAGLVIVDLITYTYTVINNNIVINP